MNVVNMTVNEMDTKDVINNAQPDERHNIIDVDEYHECDNAWMRWMMHEKYDARAQLPPACQSPSTLAYTSGLKAPSPCTQQSPY